MSELEERELTVIRANQMGILRDSELADDLAAALEDAERVENDMGAESVKALVKAVNYWREHAERVEADIEDYRQRLKATADDANEKANEAFELRERARRLEAIARRVIYAYGSKAGIDMKAVDALAADRDRWRERAAGLEAALRVISTHPQAPTEVVGIARATLAPAPAEEDG